MDFLFAGVGLVILLLAGDALVRGAVNLALRAGIPALIVSLTIVAFGTSAPELLISVGAIIEGAPGLALGNVVGSNTANILLVLGIPAIISRLDTSQVDTRHSYVAMLLATLVFIGAAFFGTLTWMHGILFLAVLAAVLAMQARAALAHRNALAELEDDLEGADPEMRGWKIALFLLLGLVGLPLGAEILIRAALDIATDFGVSESVIGLTLVAIGTSLPELATTVMAAIRRQADVALGNVVGSNLFNLMGIMGVALFFGDIPVDPQFLRVDLWVMLAASLVIAPFVFHSGWKIGRRWGIVLTALYLGYLAMVVSA